jgi:hypothetical protein
LMFEMAGEVVAISRQGKIPGPGTANSGATTVERGFGRHFSTLWESLCGPQGRRMISTKEVSCNHSERGTVWSTDWRHKIRMGGKVPDKHLFRSLGNAHSSTSRISIGIEVGEAAISIPNHSVR